MTCQKIPYGSKAGAKAAARRATSTHGGPAMEAYRCSCGSWHVGHSKAGTVVPCRTCGRPVTLTERAGGRLIPVDDSGQQHDSRHCSREAAIA